MSRQGAEQQLQDRAAERRELARRDAATQQFNKNYNEAFDRAAEGDYWTWVAVCILVLFVIYITAIGDLPKWIELIKIEPATAPKAGPGSPAAESVIPKKEPNTGASEGIYKAFPWLRKGPTGGST